MRTVTSVIIPMRPSEPRIISRTSGPAEDAGMVGIFMVPLRVSIVPPANIFSMRP